MELDPQAVREGHDPQLEKAVQLLLADLEKNPLPVYKKPPYPKYQRGTAQPAAAKRARAPSSARWASPLAPS